MMSTAPLEALDPCAATAVTRLIESHTLTDSLVHPTKGRIAFGVRSSQGLRGTQEDAFSVQKLSSPGDSPPSSPDQSDSESDGGGSSVAGGMVLGIPNDLDIFCVFDGHGGNEVSSFCSEKIPGYFLEALKQGSRGLLGSPTGSPSPAASPAHQPAQLETVVGVDASGSLPVGSLDGGADGIDTCTVSASAAALTADPLATASAASPTSSGEADGVAKGEVGRDAGVQLVTDALRFAFLRTDHELAGSEVGEFVGATAVVAVLGKEHIWIAHCGDSRAVLSRGGEAEPVTLDHKPDREDEAARVRAAGGKVVFTSGSYRVMGMLAMSRAIGDHFLRPYVIAEPEVTVLERTSQDEVLVIATDGLWDVFSNAEATALASRCIARSMERGMSRHGACRVAASVLTKAALERGSRDNVTVIVVDISPRPDDQLHAEQVKRMVPSSARQEGRKLSQLSSFSVGTHVRIRSGASASEDGGSRSSGRGGGGGSASGATQRQGSMRSEETCGLDVSSGQQDASKGLPRALSRGPVTTCMSQRAVTSAAAVSTPQLPMQPQHVACRVQQPYRQVSPWLMASLGCPPAAAAAAVSVQQPCAGTSVLGTRHEHPSIGQGDQRPHKVCRLSASGRMASVSACALQAGAEVPAASSVPHTRVVETCASSMRGVGWGGPHRLLMH